MKKLLVLAMGLIIACNMSFAQDAKERKEIQKMARKELSAKVDKVTKKEAKRLTKEGWVVSPGALPLEKQLQRSYEMQYQSDDMGEPKYIMAESQSIGENYDAAKNAATSLAVINLAAQIQREVTSLVKDNVDNKQLSSEDAVSITETINANQTLISQSIGRVITVVECYRVLKNKNREVMVRILYNADKAKQATKKILREELEKKGEDLQEQLDKALGF